MTFRAIIILSGIVLSTSAFAGTGSWIFSDRQYVIGISAGPTWIYGNKTQTINLEPDVAKTYTANSNNHMFPTGELFLGVQNALATSFIGQPLMSQLGIDFVAAGRAQLTGDIWEDADPDFDNFNYTYKVNHTHVAIKGRLVVLTNKVQPYISGSVGVGVNRAYDFTITPKISEEVPAPPFGSHNQTSFVYTLGIGIQTALTSQLQFAIGYEFADWGKTQLSTAQGQTTNQTLSLNHLYANQLQLSLFYII